MPLHHTKDLGERALDIGFGTVKGNDDLGIETVLEVANQTLMEMHDDGRILPWHIRKTQQPPEELVPARELEDIPFPDCGSRCSAIEYLGAGECEAVCSFKFARNGEPLTQIEINNTN